MAGISQDLADVLHKLTDLAHAGQAAYRDLHGAIERLIEQPAPADPANPPEGGDHAA